MKRSELVKLVFEAQDAYRVYVRTGRTYTKEAKRAKARRAILETQLMRLDHPAETARATAAPKTTAARQQRRLY